MKVTKLLVTGAVAAAVAAPLGQAANDRVQVAGSIVSPSQISAAQLRAGHDPATRLVQVGGALVKPSQMSTYQNSSGGTRVAAVDDSSGLGSSAIAAIAALGSALVLAAASALVVRHRRGLATA